MGKMVNDLVLDSALQYIKDNTTQMTVCKDTPTTYNEATIINAFMLALITITTADMSIANGATGRMVTIVAKSGVTITGSSTQTASHVCLCASAANLLYVTTCAGQALINGNTVTIPTWSITIADPTA